MKTAFKAFTLMELLIGMIISSLVISLGYMSYNILLHQYSEYKATKAELVEAIQLNAVLGRDAANAGVILYDNNSLKLNYDSDRKLEYLFGENYVLRKTNEVVDTFKLKPTTITFVDMAEGNLVKKPLISFSFDLVVAGEIEHFQFKKVYDGKTLVNNELQNLLNK